MRIPLFSTSVVAAAAFAIVGAVAPIPAQSQQPKGQQPQQQPKGAPPPAAQQPQAQQPQPPSPPKPYKPVAIKLPQPVADPSFAAFRKQLAQIAQKKDRAGLAKVVAKNFFWIPEDKDVADPKRSGIDNLSKAIGLEGKDASGWEVISSYAADATADPYPERQGVICAPGDPQFDEKAAEALANETQTDAAEWGYPVRDGVEVRSGPGPNNPVIEKLGLHLVRAYPDDSPASAVQADFLRIVTPSGKLGFIPADTLLPVANDQFCYVKEGNAWRIAGVIGGSSQ